MKLEIQEWLSRPGRRKVRIQIAGRWHDLGNLDYAERRDLATLLRNMAKELEKQL